jgi:tRNA threonylcarbamoyladenosine biosynthesis protein TsaE
MATFISHSPSDTEGLGEAWGRAAHPGLVIGLSGELGVGKTRLVHGLARGLGSRARVHSPTFALVNIYEGGKLVLYHMDLYRLDSREQIEAAGLREYLDAGGVAVIEWVEKWFGKPGSSEGPANLVFPCRHVQIEALGDSERRIDYEDFGG